MKKIILFLFSVFLFSKEIIIKKDNNSTTILKEQKIWLLNHINFFTPDFLNIAPEDSLIKFKISYNTQQQKTKISLNAKLILPSFEKKVSKIKISKNKLSTKIFTFKITPLFLIYKSIPTPILKTNFNLKNDYIIKYSAISETIYYYFIHNELKEITTFAINKLINISNLKFKISKTYLSTDKNNLYYSSGIYYYTTTNKFIRTYGFEINGERKKLPVIYQYKLLFDYRHTLFNKKYIYLDVIPYIYANKDYHYKIKPAMNISFNINF